MGSLYAYVRRYACRVRRSLFSSGLEREQRRKYEFGEAMAQNKPFFFFADWERTQEETGKYECTAEKTDKIAFQCFVCGKINVFPATHADGNTCKYCGGGLKAIGYAKKTEGSRNAEK